VTVCIAAICQHEGQFRIVTCADWKQETDLAGSETADKIRLLPKEWVALMAGALNRAEELVGRYERKLRNIEQVEDDEDLYAVMKEPASQHKEALADDYIRHMLGISYKEFLERANTLPQEFVADKLKEISSINLGAALILAGFMEVKKQVFKNESLPYLFVVDDSGTHQDVVRAEDNFAVIGTGAYVAIPALNQREQDDNKNLMETIYNVYEAKRLAEVVLGVGQATSIDVIGPNGVSTLSEAGAERCKRIFAGIGPKLHLSEERSRQLFEFKPEYLGAFEVGESATSASAGS